MTPHKKTKIDPNLTRTHRVTCRNPGCSHVNVHTMEVKVSGLASKKDGEIGRVIFCRYCVSPMTVEK